MSEAQESNEYDGPHEGPIKTPRQLVITVILAFVVPVFIIVLLVMHASTQIRPAAGTDALTDPMSIRQRIQPVGMVEVKDVSDVASLKTGEQVFQAQCSACHTAGTLGAPKLGDADAWAPRIKTGYDTLVHAAIAGMNQMPAQGGGDFSDYEIARAVVYMANKSGGKLAEPPAPAGSAAASAATSATTTAAVLTPPAVVSAPATPAATAPMSTAASAATTVAIAATATPTPAAPAGAPPALYAQICAACHASGVAGAPKLGDKAAWAPRLPLGIDGLTAVAISGKGAMPPRGGSSASDADLKAVVTYMVGSVR